MKLSRRQALGLLFGAPIAYLLARRTYDAVGPEGTAVFRTPVVIDAPSPQLTIRDANSGRVLFFISTGQNQEAALDNEVK